jgi:hypothetical protein
MRPDGSCPTCGQVLELRKPQSAPVATVEPAADAAEDPDARPKAPWHFKLMLVALAVYLAWRGLQGVDWIARHL